MIPISMIGNLFMTPNEELKDAAWIAFQRVKEIEGRLNEALSAENMCSQVKNYLIAQIQLELDGARRDYYKEKQDFRRYRRLENLDKQKVL